MEIYIRGVHYPYVEQDNQLILSLDDKEIRVEIKESYEDSVDALTSALLKELDLVQVVFTHSRNVFKRNAFGVFLHPFFSKYLGCNVDEDNNTLSNENCRFEGFEVGYYYPSFTIKKDIWDSAKIPHSYSKNIVKIL